MWDIPLLLDSMQYFLVSNTIGSNDLLHPPPDHISELSRYT
jgi:hypothetical protein